MTIATKTKVRVLTTVAGPGAVEAIQFRLPHRREGELLRLREGALLHLREGGPRHPLSRRSRLLLQDHALGLGLASAGPAATASIRVAGMELCARMVSRQDTTASRSLTHAWIGVSGART